MLENIKTEYINRFDPDFAYLKQAIRTSLGALIAIIIYRTHPQWSQGYWVILSAVFLMQTRLGSSQLSQLITVILSGVGAALLAFLASLFWHNTYLLALFLAITSFITIYSSIFGLNFAIACFFVNLFAIMSAGLIIPHADISQRCLMILTGDAIALLMCQLWPTHIEPNLQSAITIYFNCLADYCNKLGFYYIKELDQKQRKKLEKLYRERRNRALRFLRSLRKSYQLLPSERQRKYSRYIELSEQLFLSINALGNLRHRLTDKFQVNHLDVDLKTIHAELANYLTAIAQHQPLSPLQTFKMTTQHLQPHPLTNEDLQLAITAFMHTANSIVSNLQRFQLSTD